MLENNRITNLLDIQYPIIEGGMAWVGSGKLAAAISNAGGLGTIGSGSMTPDILEKHIDQAQKLTDKPFAVNIIMINPYVDQLVDLAIEKNVPVIIFAAGNPTKYIEKVKKNNIKVLSVVASDSHAKRLERKGIDAVIGEGMEAGGHIGKISTLVLVTKIAETIRVPLIAAGGIANAKGMKAAFSMGAEGIQMGTRFVASEECEAHEEYKTKILKAKISSTVVTGAKMGHPARLLKTKFARKVSKLETSSMEEAEDLLIGSLRKAYENGNEENGSFMAGESAGLINEIKPVEKIINDIINEYKSEVKQ